MTLYSQKLTSLATLSAMIFLSACGGGGGSDSNGNTPTESKPKPFQSSFTSSLEVIENPNLIIIPEKRYNIKSKSSNENSSVLAYSVSTQLDNSLIAEDGSGRATKFPQLGQLLHFELTQEDISLTLDIEYDPILKQATSVTLTKATSNHENPQQKFECTKNNTNTNDVCSGATINYDEVTGTATISFNQSQFNSVGSMSNLLLNLDGQLKGTLSIPPQTINNIPKTSQGSVTVDGKTHQILAAVNNFEQVIGSRLFNAGISVLLDNATNMSFTKDDSGLYSKYIDSRKGFLNAQPIDNKGLTFKDLRSASQYTLQPTLFNFSNSDNEPQQQPISISATVEAAIPQQTLTISPSPYASDSSDTSSIPNDFTINLVNHNTVEIEANDIKATIQDKKLKSIQLSAQVLSNSSSTLTRMIFLDYQCGESTTACKGVSIEPNGFGLRFNNTVLVNKFKNNDSERLPASITFKGGLVYVGR
jgi:hypothetical protein